MAFRGRLSSPMQYNYFRFSYVAAGIKNSFCSLQRSMALYRYTTQSLSTSMWVLVPVSGDDKVSGNVYVRVIYRKRCCGRQDELPLQSVHPTSPSIGKFLHYGSPGGSVVKNLPAMQEAQI